MREARIENRLVRKIEKRGGMAPKWSSPGMRGVPDRIVILPNRIIFVELKAPGKVPRPLQEKRAKMLRDMGHEVRCIDSVEDVDRFVEEVLPFWSTGRTNTKSTQQKKF